jgi:hypothetical protein
MLQTPVAQLASGMFILKTILQPIHKHFPADILVCNTRQYTLFHLQQLRND